MAEQGWVTLEITMDGKKHEKDMPESAVEIMKKSGWKVKSKEGSK